MRYIGVDHRVVYGKNTPKCKQCVIFVKNSAENTGTHIFNTLMRYIGIDHRVVYGKNTPNIKNP